MPTYDYKCDACGKQFERFQNITADPIRVCPFCGEKQVTRLLTGGSGLIFKGSGFYITDYKNKQSNQGKEKKTKSTDKSKK